MNCKTVGCLEIRGSSFCETCSDYTESEEAQIRKHGTFTKGEAITLTLVAIILTLVSPIGLIAWPAVFSVWRDLK